MSTTHLNFFISVTCFLITSLNAHGSSIVPFDLSRELQTTTKQDIVNTVNSQTFSRSQRHHLINATIQILTEINPNRFIQLNVVKYDAIPDLQMLRKKERSLSNFDFHQRLVRIFSRMNDFHTVYTPPFPLSRAGASLMVDFIEYYKPGEKRPSYLRGETDEDESQFPNFPIASEIVSMDGKPVRLVAYRLGRASFGANVGAGFASATALLTNRILSILPPPRKESVVVEYVHPNGTHMDIRLPWKYAIVPADESSNITIEGEVSIAKNFEKTKMMRRKKPSKNTSSSSPIRREEIKISEELGTNFKFEVIHSTSLPYTKMSVESFMFNITNDTLLELIEVVTSIEPPRLVVDIRENGGGSVLLASILFEMVSKCKTPPIPYFVRATETVARMVKNETLAALAPSVRDAIRAGEQFAGPASDLNDVLNTSKPVERFIPQIFKGELIVLIDGSTYSAGDLFAGWVKDQQAGLVVGVHPATGGGGATVLDYNKLIDFDVFPKSSDPLPEGHGISTAFSRLFRTGRSSGAFIENRGVKADERYFVTKNDALNNDEDLLQFIANSFSMNVTNATMI